MDWTQTIKRCFASDFVLYTSHARREMRQEPFGTISEEEVFEAISASEIIEEYLDDEPYPSVLLFGLTQANRPLHVVCAYDAESDRTIVITVYHPDRQRWRDYRRRSK